MPDKETIFDNIARYSVAEIARFILDGKVTFEELIDPSNTFGEFSHQNQRKVLDILNGNAPAPKPDPVPPTPQPTPEPITPEPKAAPGDPWTQINKKSIDELRAYIKAFPTSNHIRQARKLLNDLIANAAERPEDLLESLRKELLRDGTYANVNRLLESNVLSLTQLKQLLQQDTNLLHAVVVRELLDKGDITVDDLHEAGISPELIINVQKYTPLEANFNVTQVNQITKVSTEIYMWGIPSSGKSCALGAILSTANDGHTFEFMRQDNSCQGYGYMNTLASLFRPGEVGHLPPRTSVTQTTEMGFDLKAGSKYHPVTLIDLAGELMVDMYLSDTDPTQIRQEDMRALATVTKLMMTKNNENRKIHIFVIEYGGHDKVYRGNTQSVYLNGAFNYIKRMRIFDKVTDAVYILFTKCDRTGYASRKDMVQELMRYTDQNYRAFYNNLCALCKENHINGGEVPRIAFTLGQVAFQDLCLFDNESAKGLLNALLPRIPGYSEGKLSNLLNNLKK